MLIGVDEAGRGPVLGSLFVAAVGFTDPAELSERIADSKTLSPAVREKLADDIRGSASELAVVEITPNVIDEHPGELNRLTLEASVAAVEDVLPDQETARIIADACDVSETRYRDRMIAQLPDDVNVEAYHGADGQEPIVGAASIVAKSAREAQVAQLNETFGDLGSGYPSDPSTRAFLGTYLKNQGELPSCARHTWKTCRDLLTAVEQGKLTEF